MSSSKTASSNHWLWEHPRALYYLCVLVPVFLWQSVVAVLGVLLFFLWVRLLKLPLWITLGFGVAVAGGLLLARASEGPSVGQSLLAFFEQGFFVNVTFWEGMLDQDRLGQLVYFLYGHGLDYVLGFPLLVAGLLHGISLIPDSGHYQALRALQGGKVNVAGRVSEKPVRKVEAALAQVSDSQYEGTLLGVSKRSGQVVVLPDAQVNQLVLVLGTTGSGKTITLRRFYQRALLKNYPLIIVDGKPTAESIAWIQEKAMGCGKAFYGFNGGNYWHYDPLAHGGYTELKDKVISLKEEWSSDYYRSIAEDYLQTTFEVLVASGEPFDLKRVVACLDYEELALLVRQMQDEKLAVRVKRLASYDKKDITGLQAHLSLLIHSELGAYFEKKENYTFTLREVIDNQGVVYFALPALRFPSFSKVLGKLIINDIKAVIDRDHLQKVPIFTVFDEFSVFAGEQVLNLVNMGRGKGVHAVFGTQGLADLQKIELMFCNQVLNCVNTVICHRLNDQVSAETVAGWGGTRETFDVTAQVDLAQGSTGLGSVRRNKEFIVHPDAIKQELQPGEAFYFSKVGKFVSDKIKVKYS